MEEITKIVSILESAMQRASAGPKAPADQGSGGDDAVANCFWDKHKEELFWEENLIRARGRWQIEGVIGFVQSMRYLALSQKKIVGEASANHVWDDIKEDVPPVLTYYMWNMHPLFLDGVLSGELTRNMYSTKGDQLRSAVSRYHTLDNYPGIYLNIFCRKQYPSRGNTQGGASPWAGFGFTPREYDRICEKIRLYLGSTNDSVEY